MKKFEERLSRLEEINTAIKGGGDLDESLKLFEEGVKLAKSLEKDLIKVERRIEILVNEPVKEEGEEPNLELFPELND
ncbi:MAG: exodeoxyribonuclease VII small subunit [Spirochaetales bacterium]|uniref:Exodeoxyribonuclease 7 small subunit n=1 Tax=Candidatus Thalassospirochaeta sargassi TaxID=3119039 RepID=A0AAJ1MK44_9SPIO|nr:exodeoxyribonuclease VII small subunit [Spirochaetales bacterium]